jgi:protein SCO1/2
LTSIKSATGTSRFHDASSWPSGCAWASRLILLAFALLGAAPAPAQTTAQLKREVASIGVEERLGAVVPRSAIFTDSEGLPVTLADLGGRPLLVSFNYTSCPRLCGLQLSGLSRALRDLGWSGDRFGVLTVSIDPGEQRPQLARYKQAHVREVGGGAGLEQAWRFVTGAKADVDALAAAVGFKYRFDPKTREYAHQATLVVLTGDGRVSGYLHGISYPVPALTAALERAGSNRVASAEEQRSVGGFLLSCMGYDPADPAPLALKAMRTGGTVALVFLVSFLGYQALRGARRRRLQEKAP